MYEFLEYAGELLFGPLAAVRLEWLRWAMLIACLLVYCSITVWISNFGSGSASGAMTIFACGLALFLALLAMAAADRWLAPLLPSVPHNTLVLSALAVAWLAACGPIIAAIFGIKYSHALVAWMLGILAGLILSYLLVHFWASVLGGKVNIDKLRQQNQISSQLGG